MIDTTNEERIYSRHLSGNRQVSASRSWCFSAMFHLGVVTTVFLLSIHPGRVLAPVSLQPQSGVVHANLLARLPNAHAHGPSQAVVNTPQSATLPKLAHATTNTKSAKRLPTTPARPKRTVPAKVQSQKLSSVNSSNQTASASPIPSKKSGAMHLAAEGATPKMAKSAGVADAQVNKPDIHPGSGIPRLVAARYDGTPIPASYPVVARRLGQQGLVVVEVWLDKEGKQDKRLIKRSSGFALLDKAALEMVIKNRFLPYSEGGIPKPSRLLVPIAFKLQG